jgi:DUF2937 family protein
MFTDYLRLVLFAVGLLAGVQVPGFIDQYAKRVSAHQMEVATDFRGFQETADRYFGGNVEALIAHHAASTDPPFREEGAAIQSMYQRLLALRAEDAAMHAPLIAQLLHVALRANREILAETRAAYSYTVPLNASAIACGIAAGTLLALCIEALFRGLLHLLRTSTRSVRVRRVPQA